MEATVTTKGQITLPKAIRDAMHLKSGDKLVFELLENGTYIIRPKTTVITSLKGCVRYQGKSKTLAEIEAAIENRPI